MSDVTIEPATTALVLIDRQRGITGGQTLPNAAADVIARAARLAAACTSTASGASSRHSVEYARSM